MSGSAPQLLTASYHRCHREAGVAVAISLGQPRWPLPYSIAAEVRDLMPVGLLRRPRLPAEQFTPLYLDRLNRIGSDRIAAQLRRIADEHGEPLVLLCWERPGEFCHRRLFADWWQQRAGEEVPEL
jgi:hypothetical protein